MMATIEELQEELLLKIFSHYIRSEGHETFLRNVRRVCKRWNKFSSDSSLWRDVRARDWNFLLNVSRRGLLSNTQSLEFDFYDESFSEVNLSAVLKDIRDLKALDLGDNAVSSYVIKLVTKKCPHLESLRLMVEKPTTSHEWDEFLTVCGPTLKHLDVILFKEEWREQLLSKIASKCPLLERLVISFEDIPFPMHELQRGCPKLRELEFVTCRVIDAGKKGSLGCGFMDLKKFIATRSDFGGLHVHELLKDFMNLEHLELNYNDNLVLDNISKIPSEEVKILKIGLDDPQKNLEALGDAIFKWRRTLSDLDLWSWRYNISCVLKHFFRDNPNPQLESLAISDNIDLHILKKFIQKCQNLTRIKINVREYEGREKFKEALEFLREDF